MQLIRLFLLSVALDLVACVPIRPGMTSEVTPSVPGGTASSLANSSWQLVSFGPVDAAAPVLPGMPITLEFKANGQLGGYSGCNWYGSVYQVQDNTLTLGPVSSRLRGCEDDKLNQQEQHYLKALQAADQFQVSGDHLTIWYDNRQSVLNLVAGAAAIPTPAGVTPTIELTTPPALTPTAGSGSSGEHLTRIVFAPGKA